MLQKLKSCFWTTPISWSIIALNIIIDVSYEYKFIYLLLALLIDCLLKINEQVHELIKSQKANITHNIDV